MLRIMNDLPDNVLGVSAEGKVTGTDYETVLIPAVEEKLKTNKKLRMLYQLGSNFEGFDFTAMFDDAKLGMRRASVWEKIAFVSDHHYVNAVKFFRHLIPCEVRIFKNSELDEAKKWITNIPVEHNSATEDVDTNFPLSGGTE